MMTVHETIGVLILAILGSGSLSSVISICLTQYFKNKDKKLQELDTVENAVKALMHDAYIRHCRYLLGKKEIGISEDELENHGYLWRSYSALGMNGKGEKMHKQIEAMTVIPDAPEWDAK